MKVLMLNGSPHPRGNTYQSLEIIGEQLLNEGIEYEIFQLGAGLLRDCVDCKQCQGNGCVFDDDLVNEFTRKAAEADGFVFGTPVYYAHPSGRVLSFLDRAFYSCSRSFRHKPGAAVAIARRGGTTASLDVMNKYFGISQMPVVGSTYWNLIHGHKQGEVQLDPEGVQTMWNLGQNMAWLIKCIKKGEEMGVPRPKIAKGAMTNFIR